MSEMSVTPLVKHNAASSENSPGDSKTVGSFHSSRKGVKKKPFGNNFATLWFRLVGSRHKPNYVILVRMQPYSTVSSHYLLF